MHKFQKAEESWQVGEVVKRPHGQSSRPDCEGWSGRVTTDERKGPHGTAPSLLDRQGQDAPSGKGIRIHGGWW